MFATHIDSVAGNVCWRCHRGILPGQTTWLRKRVVRPDGFSYTLYQRVYHLKCVPPKVFHAMSLRRARHAG